MKMAAFEFSLFSAYYTSHQPRTLDYINQPKARVATDVCHVVIIINNPVNRTAKCLKGISVPTKKYNDSHLEREMKGVDL
jgi:hypothetical protein